MPKLPPHLTAIRRTLTTAILTLLTLALVAPAGPASAVAPRSAPVGQGSETDTDGARAVEPDDADTQGEEPVSPSATPLSTASTAAAAATTEVGTAAAIGGTTATFVGHGQGHLRGMSQWGSFGYAVDYGWSYTRILDHYYGGTVMGTVPNSAMTIRLRAQTGKNLIVTGTSMRINGTASARKALRVVRVGANKFRVDGANSCGGPWTVGAARTGPVVISRPGWSTIQSSTLLGVCSSNQVRYYGGTLTSVDAGGVQETVDAIPLETYLRGVVPRESPAYWGSGGGGKGINALRSQAVAARSYALASTNTSYAKTCDTTECQVYGGMYVRSGAGSVEALHSANSDRAVADTRGQVRKFRSTGAIARTEFGASSGGWTAGETFPAVQDLGDNTTDQTGLHNPYHSWTFKFSMAQVQSALGISGITDVRVTATAGVGPTGGKATRITVYAASGRYTFGGDTIRRAFGLYSNWFRITTDTAARRSATSVVQALYHDLLGRPADAAGLRTWVNRMVAGGSAEQVADALTGSAEYSRVLTKRLYAGATGTTPNSSTLSTWTTRWKSWTYAKAAGTVYGSDAAFRHAGSTTNRWIDLVFRGLIGTAASAASIAYWRKSVAVYGRARTAERIAGSAAAGRWGLRVLYRTMLGGPPSSGALAHYSTEMTKRGIFTRPGLVANSSAYRSRAQRLY